MRPKMKFNSKIIYNYRFRIAKNENLFENSLISVYVLDKIKIVYYVV